MESSPNLYRIIIEFVWQSGIRFHDLRCLFTFAWAVTGLLLSSKVNLGEWAVFGKSSVQASSKERQFSRWLHNGKINPGLVYRPMIRKVMAEWQEKRVYLALDSSMLWDRFVLVRLALVYRGRALPLSWTVLVSHSAMVKLQDYQGLLQEAAALLPRGCQVVLLADRGFADRKLMGVLREMGWHWRIRVKCSVWVYYADGRHVKVGRLIPAKGQALFLHKVWLTKQRFGPVYLALAHAQTPDGYEKWAILSDEPTDLQTFNEYGLRFNIEENFLDDKSGGFQLESSEIREAVALQRLGLILAVATLYLVSSGVAAVSTGVRRLVDAHWQRGLSYFHIGWRWIKYALSHNMRLLRFLWIDPEPDPCPAIASKLQAAKPTATATLSALPFQIG
jgi:hypothetical protein